MLEMASAWTKATLLSPSVFDPLNAEETQKEQDIPAFFMHTSGATGQYSLCSLVIFNL